MNVGRTFRAVALFIAAASAALSTSPQAMALQRPPRAFAIERNLPTKSGLVFISAWTTGIIYVFSLQGSNPFPIGTITDGITYPFGIAVDTKGTLYVLNASGVLAEYPKGRVHPSALIQVLPNSQEPTGVAVDGSGTVYVSANEGGVSEFLAGQSKPVRTISGFTAPAGIAVDKDGNLFVADERLKPYGGVWRVKAGETKPVLLDFDGLFYPLGIAVDSREQVYVSIPDQPAEVLVYRQGRKTPIRTITDGLTYPWLLSMTPHDDLFVADNGEHEGVEYAPGASSPYQVFANDVQAAAAVAVLPPSP